MKVYLEEKDMPKDCVNCNFGYANNFCELDYELDLRKFDKNQKHPKCPLQSLTDHDKQVRKEVVQEFRQKGERTYTISPSSNKPKKEVLIIPSEILDQIEQGETDAKD